MLLRGRAEVARQAHNLEAVGSIPTPATNDFSGLSVTDGLFFASFSQSRGLLFVSRCFTKTFALFGMCCLLSGILFLVEIAGIP